MIELRNVSKTYKPSKRVAVNALSNINLLFKEKGFVVLTGESGSGKTTLLNILAGLDVYTQGDMLIDGISTKRIKEKTWDEYRNKRVGIVFQNYSLLEEFSVKKNVSLALELQRISDKKDWVEWALDKVNMYDCMDKRVNKLSGGQKQRVAIARAIVKDPQIILADEPTGNLDTTNSEEIFELLKDLSKEHLVVVITHNVELANKYADRIIRLVDGEVVEDTKLTNELLEEPTKEKSLPPKGLKVSSILGLGLSSMAKQWFRLLATIMMLIVMLTSIGIALGVSRYSKNSLIAEAIIQGNNSLLPINKYTEDNVFSKEDEKWLKANGYKCIPIIKNDNYLVFNRYGVATGVNGSIGLFNEEISLKKYYSMQPNGFVAIEDIKECGCEYDLVKGAWPSNSFEVCITKYSASVLMADGAGVRLSGSTLDLEDSRAITMDEIIGAPVRVNDNTLVTITGIVDTKLDDKYFDAKKENYEELFEELKGIHNVIFATKAFVDNVLTFNPILRIAYPAFAMVGDLYMFRAQGNALVYPIDKLQKMGNYTYDFMNGDKILDENEILVSKGFFISLLNERAGRIDYSSKTENIDNIIRSEIESGFSFSSTVKSSLNNETQDIKSITLKVVGITDAQRPVVSASLNDLVDTTIATRSTTYLVAVNNLDVDSLIKLNETFGIATSQIYDINSVSNRANQVKVLGVLLGILFGVLSIITMYDFMQSTIKGNYRHIGILRALGTNKKDIYLIYSVEVIVLAMVSIVLAMLALNPIMQYLDSSSYAQEKLGVSLFETRAIDYVLIVIVGTIVTFASAIVVMHLSLKRTIIDLIYKK